MHGVNSLYESLTFTRERQKDRSLTMLDMCILNEGGNLSSTWYSKPSATGLIMNHEYKRAMVSGLVYRIYRFCSNWTNFHESLQGGKTHPSEESVAFMSLSSMTY